MTIKFTGESVWFDKRASRYVAELRYIDEFGEQKKPQRRGKSKAEAKNAIERLRQELLNSTPQEKLRFSDAFEEFVDLASSDRSEQTMGHIIVAVRSWFMPSIGRKNLSEITTKDLALAINSLEVAGCTVETLKTAKNRISVVFGFFVKMGYITSNPARSLPKYSHSANGRTLVKDAYSEDEAKTLIDHCKGTRLELFVYLTLVFGLRKGEALGLIWEDFDFEKGVFYIRRSRSERKSIDENNEVKSRLFSGDLKTKGSIRQLPITPGLSQALMNQRELNASTGSQNMLQETVILGQSGKPIGISTIHRNLKMTFEVAGLREIRVHDFRHTSAELALKNEARLEEVSEALGHTGVDITKRVYAARVPALASGFANKIEAALDVGQIEPQGAISGEGVKS